MPAELPPAEAPRAAGNGTASITVALFGIGDHHIALPIDLVGAAITRPRSLAPAPESCAGLLGTFEHAGQCYPLIDLRVALGSPATPIEDEGHAVLLDLGNSETAIVVDRIEGIRSLRSDAIVPLRVVSGATITSVTHVEGYDRPVTVLLAADLLALEGLALAETSRGRRDGSERANAAPGRGTRSWLSVSRQGIVYALDVSCVVEIVTNPDVITMALPQPGALGRIAARGKDVLLLDRLTPDECRAPGAAAPTCALVLVLEVEDLRFAVPVDAVHTLSKLSTSAALPGTKEGRAAGVTLAEAPSGGPPQVVLDPAALLAAPETRAIVAYYNRQAQGENRQAQGENRQAQGENRQAQGEDVKTSSTHRAFLELETEGRFYVALTDIQEIATFPRSTVVRAEGNHRADGYVCHRGDAVAIVDLAAQWKSGHASGESMKTVIVRDPDTGGHVGFVVDRVTSIEYFEVVEIPQSGADSAAVIRAAGHDYRRFWHLVEAQGRDRSRIVSVFDILKLARGVLA
ncbi:chemotaxis protein CheW [uncultured Jannaschia sp.]|uniref:chemotaxis protein CheW n=1 Tax=uncultured Jannaschia sp. TaxID=293347 RepID=UPI0026172A8D|nr:chemotaxis protein CheW [uncultured Jannaschia sp.]